MANIPIYMYISSQRRIWTIVVVVTVLAITASLFVTTATLFYLNAVDTWLAYKIALITPLVTAPPTTYWFAYLAYQLHLTNHQLFQLAYTDALTNLLNRRGFFTQVQQMLNAGREKGQTTALLLLDMNNFKQINDTLGHPAGNNALRFLAQTLKKFANADDLIARLGGDEFAILRQGATRHDLLTLAQEITAYLAQTPYDDNGVVIHLSLSSGASDTRQALTVEGLLKKSDVALYLGKTEHYRHSGIVQKQAPLTASP